MGAGVSTCVCDICNSAFMSSICFVRSTNDCWYTESCSATSGPGWRANMFLSSRYSFSLCCISSSLSTTSSLFSISRFWGQQGQPTSADVIRYTIKGGGGRSR